MRSLRDGLRIHANAIKSGITPTIPTCNKLIHLYAKHGLIIEAGKLFDEMPERNVFTWNTIINAHIKTQNLTQAQALFHAAPMKDSVTYNSMLSGYVNSEGYESNAVKMFGKMQAEHDKVKIDEFGFTTMLNLTAKLDVLSYGRQLHSFMVKVGNDFDGFSVSALIDMYSKCGCFRDAWDAFNGCWNGMVDLVSKNAMVAACCREGEVEMAGNIFWREPELNDTVSWNTLISGYAQNGYEKEAIEMFKRMSDGGFTWNEHTMCSVLSACAGMKSLKLGKEVHAWVLKKGMSLNSFISSGLVDVYCKSGNMKYANTAYTTVGVENSFSISSMIMGSLLQGDTVEARKLFDSLEEKNSVVWTAMFSGFVKSQLYDDVFELFREFIAKDATVPDDLILISVLGAASIQATVEPGKQIHANVLRMGIEMDEKMTSAIVDMYSKCGNIAYAQNIFRRVDCRDSVLYNVMIAGHAHHGYEYKAIQLFEEMRERGFKPDAVSFIAVLSACRHCGLVELGEKYFSSMTQDYAISPDTDHYACMIDLYGRANLLDKAVAFMEKIPTETDAVILGTFLNACKMKRNAELARKAEEKLLKLEGDNGSRYVQLANVYASDGMWDEKGRIMKKMRGKEVKKIAGCSWVHVGNRVHVFTSGDISHSETEALYSILAFLATELTDMAKLSVKYEPV